MVPLRTNERTNISALRSMRSNPCSLPPVPTSSHTKHDITDSSRCHRLHKPPIVIRQVSFHPQPFELFHHLPLNLQLQRPRDGFGFVRALQASDRLDHVDQVDHVARVAVVQSAEFFVVGGQIVDEAEVVADESEIAREARVRDGGAGFDTEFGGGDDEAMNPRMRDLSERAVKGWRCVSLEILTLHRRSGAGIGGIRSRSRILYLGGRSGNLDVEPLASLYLRLCLLSLRLRCCPRCRPCSFGRQSAWSWGCDGLRGDK